MPKLTDINYNALLYLFKGEPGMRKSSQALSFPLPQYWISTDHKMESLGTPAREWGIDTNQVDYDDYTTYNDIRKKLRLFQTNCKYKTLIIDSVTSTGDCVNEQTLGVKTEAGKGKVVGDIKVNSLEDYKAEARAFQEILALISDIRRYHKINIILIGHVVGQRDPVEVSTTQQSRIIITGGKTISGKIAAKSTEVYHFDIKKSADVDQEGTYEVVTVHTGDDFARTSLNLEGRLRVGNKPLYTTYIKPAIDKLSSKK